MGSLSLEQLEALISPFEQKQRLNNLSPEGRRQLRDFVKAAGMLEEIEAEISPSKKWSEKAGAYVERKRKPLKPKPELSLEDWLLRIGLIILALGLIGAWSRDPWAHQRHLRAP